MDAWRLRNLARTAAMRLREGREKADMTQWELADAIGRAQSFVSNYERGARQLNVAEYVLIASVLQLDLAQEMNGLLESLKWWDEWS